MMPASEDSSRVASSVPSSLTTFPTAPSAGAVQVSSLALSSEMQQLCRALLRCTAHVTQQGPSQGTCFKAMHSNK